MALRREEFSIGEWYHCFSRGIDKRTVFEKHPDYTRFLEQLYLANTDTPLRRDDIGQRSLEEIVRIPRGNPLVAIGAFCLMPNHFHLVLKEICENGISAFMQKLGTAYTMYFNAKNERTGGLFTKPFRSRHVADDRYFQHLINYVHCNPAEIYEPKWKNGGAQNISKLADRLLAYPYSSLGAYEYPHVPTRALLDNEVFDAYRSVSAKAMVRDAAQYYEEHAGEIFG